MKAFIFFHFFVFARADLPSVGALNKSITLKRKATAFTSEHKMNLLNIDYICI